MLSFDSEALIVRFRNRGKGKYDILTVYKVKSITDDRYWPTDTNKRVKVDADIVHTTYVGCDIGFHYTK